jgi:predicted nucleic acid-binding protein
VPVLNEFAAVTPRKHAPSLLNCEQHSRAFARSVSLIHSPSKYMQHGRIIEKRLTVTNPFVSR